MSPTNCRRRRHIEDSRMGEWTLAFDEVGRGDVGRVGGKAANLGELTRAGLPVPHGFCVTAAAYRRFVGDAGVRSRIESLLAGLEPDDTAAVDEAGARIRDLLIGQQIPTEIEESVVAEYLALGRQMGQRTGPEETPVAVRSSATAEDLPDASFAGQQDTYLNVRGNLDVLEHVKRCWASLWTARAITYRMNQGYEHDKVALAIAVQAMVNAEIAGVMFTADPVTSDRSRLVIDGSWGLGEAIVSGLVTPDTWTVNKQDLSIVDRRISRKEREVVRVPEGGTEERDVPEERRDRPSLTDAQVRELAQAGRRIEEHYGMPMDVEWAFSTGSAYVLQARPITTLREASSTSVEGEFNRTMFIEIFPDALSPAFLSVIERLFTGMLDFTFRKLGFDPPTGIRGVAPFHAQPYFNQRYIEAALAPLRPRTRAAFVARIVNPFARERSSPLELSRPFLGMTVRLLRLMRSLHTVLPTEVLRYQRQIAQLQATDFTTLSEKELVEHIDRLVFRTANRLLNYDFLLIALVGVTYQALGRMLEPYVGDRAVDLRGRLVSGVTGNVTMETNKRIWDLAESARSSDVLVNELRRNEPYPKLRERLATNAEGQLFLKELDAFLAEYGHREVRMDILYPTWVEDPSPVIAFVRGYLDADPSASPHKQQERLIAERDEAAQTVRQALRRDLRGRLAIWPIFSWVLRHTQANTRHRDTMHFELTRLFPPFRRLLAELGTRWSARGVVSDPEDLFYLTLDEMRAAVDSNEPLGDRVATRRRQHDEDLRSTPPPIIRDGVDVWSTDDATRDADGADASMLRGVAGSPGRASGVVRVIRGPEDFHKLSPREILVAPLTNPVWTPLFAIAGGLVTEVGGILSHGAIVAREYGIPAVMAVNGATTTLTDGQIVTVDGSRGIVELAQGTA